MRAPVVVECGGRTRQYMGVEFRVLGFAARLSGEATLVRVRRRRLTATGAI